MCMYAEHACTVYAYMFACLYGTYKRICSIYMYTWVSLGEAWHETTLNKCAIRGNCSSSAMSSECCLSRGHAALLSTEIRNAGDMTRQQDTVTISRCDLCALQVDSKFLVGLGGILVVGCSVLSSMGFYSWIGIPSSLVILQVVPFLVLAVGADNIFIFVLEYQVGFTHNTCRRLPGDRRSWRSPCLCLAERRAETWGNEGTANWSRPGERGSQHAPVQPLGVRLLLPRYVSAMKEREQTNSACWRVKRPCTLPLNFYLFAHTSKHRKSNVTAPSCEGEVANWLTQWMLSSKLKLNKERHNRLD